MEIVFFKQKTAYEILSGLVGSEMCIRDSRQIYYTRVRAQIMKHMNGSLDSYLVSGQRARNKVRVRGKYSLLSTDIFVYTQLGIHTNGKKETEILEN